MRNRPCPRVLGIDEHFFTRKQGYATTFVDLGKRKGYELLYQMKGGPNVFFVAEEYFPLFGIQDNSPEAIYRPLPVAMERPEWNYGRNGVPWPEGKDTLVWDHLVIQKRFILDR